ncbi:MAG: metallophosphoesterase family protein [Desulfobacteraceae bacterium]
MKEDIFNTLEDRVGKKHLRKRLQRQMQHTALQFSGNGFRLHLENMELPFIIFRMLLKCIGLWKRGTRNAMNYRVRKVNVTFKRLPKAFDGLKLLHLSDIHTDGLVDNADQLCRLIETLEYDLCVITGDFRLLTFDDYEPSISKTKTILDSIRCRFGTFGILGNHDFIEMVPALESLGIRMLLNESVALQMQDEKIWLAGVDDCHFYEVHYLEKAVENIPRQSFRILLSHSPELFEEAGELHTDYYLCGHTHGGQICLPGGIPLLVNASCPKKYCRGAWSFNEMKGYTSFGTGSSGLPVRFHCQPEVVLHQLCC